MPLIEDHHYLKICAQLASSLSISISAARRKVEVAAPKVSTPKRPSAAKLISPQRYWSDVKTRWSIHQYEIKMLVADLTKLNKYVRQFTK